jgi:hypothetical protein
MPSLLFSVSSLAELLIPIDPNSLIFYLERGPCFLCFLQVPRVMFCRHEENIRGGEKRFTSSVF